MFRSLRRSRNRCAPIAWRMSRSSWEMVEVVSDIWGRGRHKGRIERQAGACPIVYYY